MDSKYHQDEKVGYNQYFVEKKDLKYLPPYLLDVPETREEVICTTTGTWPTWLAGQFIRVGIGRVVIPLSEDGSKPDAVLQHFFDGLNLLHKFRMEDGKVFYRSRYTAEGVVRRAKKEGRLTSIMTGLDANTPLYRAQDPCSALLGTNQSLYLEDGKYEPDEVNINVVPRRGIHLPQPQGTRGVDSPETEELLIGTDFNMLQVCDAKTLEPKRLLTHAVIDPELKGVGICAHPPKDRKRGQTFNYLINQETGVMYVFGLDIRAKPAALMWKTALPCAPCYIHSLAMTERYVIFIRNPIHMDVSDMSKGLQETWLYEPDVPTQFFVLEKDTGKHIATYSAPSFMFFHSVNAYDYVDADTGATNVHVDLCSYEGGYIPYREYSFSNVIDPARPFKDGTLVRYELASVDHALATISRPGRATVAAAIPGVPSELPRIAKSASMMPGYRYVYFTAGNGGMSPGTQVPIGRFGNGLKTVHGAFFGSLAKSDWLSGTYKRWQPGNGESCPCEPVFIGRPGATEEDDGVVLTIVINREGTQSILVALDGQTFEEIARADMPHVYALGPHGTFIEA
ncbi:hypothetical protein JX265_013172 [Neoarthrinium moseri]|uniref:Uncharacterized protein n=1 Tax=Neoarthrinium moseri TaxID=1658444 RepID=A0A9P9W8Z8_9PEZI|nr:hypothetical protein JX266_012602 [Neoarthrinium moseri]KAI1851815.1 hypothetical protein JX265_013172 [Neoarthrinium moseri]